MSDSEIREEYLWDRSGPVDPLVQRLEHVLRPHRHRPRRRPPAKRKWALAAAAVIALAVFVPQLFREERCYAVDGLSGVRHVRAGDAFEVGPDAGAVLEVASLGNVVLQPGARGRVVDCGERRHELFLEEGSLHATIQAEERVFQVGTPAGMSIDLGCEYDLTVDAEGNATLHVLSGRVAFDSQGREVVVPARASCRVEKGRVPGTPVQDDAAEAFRRAVGRVEFASEDELDLDALEVVASVDRRDDSLSLVHLLEAPSRTVRGRVFDRLARMYQAPPGVTREGILAGELDGVSEWRAVMTRDWYY